MSDTPVIGKIEQLRNLITLSCSVCAGDAQHASTINCICNGELTITGELYGLRQWVLKLEQQNKRYRETLEDIAKIKPIPQQSELQIIKYCREWAEKALQETDGE